MKISALYAILTAGVLSGCSVATVTMDAASVTHYDDGSEWIMTGKLLGSIDGPSIIRPSGGGVECETHMAKQRDGSAAGNMLCTDNAGQVVYNERQVVAKEECTMSFNGIYFSEVSTPDGPGLMAFGWGKQADPAYLRGLLPQ